MSLADVIVFSATMMMASIIGYWVTQDTDKDHESDDDDDEHYTENVDSINQAFDHNLE